jgi:hypothetical protein
MRMSNVTDFPKKIDNINAVKGPERFGNDIIIDGHVVPNMWMVDCGATIELVFPGPVAYIFPRDIAAHAAGACAKAMAVGAGHSHISSEHAVTKSYGPKAIALSEIPSDAV